MVPKCSWAARRTSRPWAWSVTCHRRVAILYRGSEGARVAEESGEGGRVCLDDRLGVSRLAVFYPDLAVGDACCEAVGADVQFANRPQAGVSTRVKEHTEAEHGGVSTEHALGREE